MKSRFKRIVVISILMLNAIVTISAYAQVVAEDYHDFWLWGDITPQPVLGRAKNLYVLQGEVRPTHSQQEVELISQGIQIPHLRHTQVWLTYRADTLHWTPQVYPLIMARLTRWRQSGNHVIGIQIDFDARTQHLAEYANFLQNLRQRLPKDCKLSITGLLDWSTTASPEDINRIKDQIDEIVVQTYQGRHTIKNYKSYLSGVSRLKLPFKVGLIQYGAWDVPDDIIQSPWFKGYVVFLQNRPKDLYVDRISAGKWINPRH